jgi:hypothetical protein
MTCVSAAGVLNIVRVIRRQSAPSAQIQFRSNQRILFVTHSSATNLFGPPLTDPGYGLKSTLFALSVGCEAANAISSHYSSFYNGYFAKT